MDLLARKATEQDEKKTGLVVATTVGIGLVALYSAIYITITGPGRGAYDWDFAFRNGARGDVSYVVTPYWVLFLSFLPAQFPDPVGYVVWLAGGMAALIVATKILGTPVWPVLLSYQLSWCLSFGQVDLFIVFGFALGYWACLNSKPLLIGLAILLVLIKPQIGLLAASAFLIWSPNRKTTILTVAAVVGLSLVVWPLWPLALMGRRWDAFLDVPANIGANTSLGLPWWLCIVVVLPAVLLPMERKRKLLALIAVSLLISPYSPIYSQVVLLSFPLPAPLYIFAVLPWYVAVRYGSFFHWGWAFIVPLSVLAYCCFPHFVQLLRTIEARMRVNNADGGNRC